MRTMVEIIEIYSLDQQKLFVWTELQKSQIKQRTEQAKHSDQ